MSSNFYLTEMFEITPLVTRVYTNRDDLIPTVRSGILSYTTRFYTTVERHAITTVRRLRPRAVFRQSIVDESPVISSW